MGAQGFTSRFRMIHHGTSAPGVFGVWLAATALVAVTGCTGQIPHAFRLAQQEDIFSTSDFQDVNTKVDMLWVIDDSGSMNVSQDLIRQGFTGFANTYMKPTWDIRVAVIPTDTYIANSAFSWYRGASTLSATSTFRSNYIRGITASGIPGRTTPFVNPSWAPNLFDVNPASATFGKATNGMRINWERPDYTANFAKLIPGNHDGPMQALCWERNGSFISASGFARCFVRDDQTGNTGVSHCVAPVGAEDSQSQCVNTLMNNTVHSGRSIISTIPPTGTPADAAWTQGLVDAFLTNMSPGFWGDGSERAFASVLQLLSDNEGTSTSFFRPGSLRVIVLVGDEDDQTMVYPSPVPATGFQPQTDYIGSCNKTIDGQTFSIANCPDSTKLVAVSSIKSSLDGFFQALDLSGAAGDPNYFITSIVASTAQSVTTLRNARGTTEIDRADRFIALGNLVGNGSLVMDIASPDYTALLDAIGQTIVSKKAIFQLTRLPSGGEELVVYIVHADGSRTQVLPSQFSVSGQTLTITDNALVLSFASTDQVLINYQPISL